LDRHVRGGGQLCVAGRPKLCGGAHEDDAGGEGGRRPFVVCRLLWADWKIVSSQALMKTMQVGSCLRVLFCEQ
jgi:hypothetical protein